MLTLHITYNTGVETIQMKTDYSEITYKDFCDIEANMRITDEHERTLTNLSLLIGLPIDEVAQLRPHELAQIIPFLSFIDRTDLILLNPPNNDLLVEIGSQPWKLLEAAKMELSSGIKGSQAKVAVTMAKVVAIYTGVDIMDMNFLDAYPIATHYMNQLESFFKQFTRLNDYTPTSEQVSAGVDRFEKYGFFTTLHALTKGNPIEYDKMLDVPAATIYQTLVMDFENSDYQKRLTDQMKSIK